MNNTIAQTVSIHPETSVHILKLVHWLIIPELIHVPSEKMFLCLDA